MLNLGLNWPKYKLFARILVLFGPFWGHFKIEEGKFKYFFLERKKFFYFAN